MVDTRFIDELASAAPTPGGGGAAAYCGALAAALASMVGNLTVGKKRDAEVEDDVRAALERLDAMRAQLVALVDEDARAFEPLAAAYRMPKSTPEEAAAKDRAMQEALIGACEAPLAIMRLCSAVIDECEFLAREGSRMAVSDAGVAVAFARAALLGASLNVYINVGSISDEGRAQAYRADADGLIADGVAQADAVYAYVAGTLGAPTA